MLKSISHFLIPFLFVACALAQQRATTEDGKKVILNPDGTWKYLENPKQPESSGSSSSSDCSNWILTGVDEVTGKPYKALKEKVVISRDNGETGFGIHAVKSESGRIRGIIMLSIEAVGAGNCIDEGAKINILFIDGTRLELKADSEFNCEAKATVYFGGAFGKSSQLQQLKSKPIKTMRVWTTDSYVQEDFQTSEAVALMNALQCLHK